MKLFKFGAASLIVAASGSVAVAQHVVPLAYAAAAGTGGFLGPLANSARTYQLLINSNQLTGVVGMDLSGITFRLLPSATVAWPAADATVTNYDIRLSESVTPAARSLTFANNVVGAQTLVRSGPLTIPAGSFTSGSSPNAFGHVIAFQTPYHYTGGHLLVEIRQSALSLSTSVDAITTAIPGYGTDFSACWTGSYTGVTGTQGNFAVTRFTVSAPPPSCYADCDGIGGLTGNDFQCFLNAFVAASSYADCDGVGGLTGNDFQCFLDKFVAGCS